MKKIFIILFIMSAGLLWSQEDSPKELRFENTVQVIGDYAQHIPTAAAFNNCKQG